LESLSVTYDEIQQYWERKVISLMIKGMRAVFNLSGEVVVLALASIGALL
jgi:hypothetical protein